MSRRLKTLLRSRETHPLPVLEGRKSRHHKKVRLGRLLRTATGAALRDGAWGKADTLVLFAGFPRSGHSLVGAALDSHPNAIIAHELDAVGLFAKGLPGWSVAALIRRLSRKFAEHGHSWNGYSYAVPDRHAKGAAKVLGDKKGDWAIRWCLEDPDLLARIARDIAPRRLKVVSVVRNPFDNIATLSLRKGRHYDAAKIAARADGGPSDVASLRERREGRKIPTAVRPEMVDDYAALCEGLVAMRASVPFEDWLELHHDAMIADPVARLSELFTFLGLDPVVDPAERAAAIVARRDVPSRHTLDWPAETRARVERLVAGHDFLRGYSFDAAPAVRAGDPPAPAIATPARQAPQAAPGWTLRQLTFGSDDGIGHFHSYYDIPVMNGDASRVAAVRFDTPQREITADDRVGVGIVDAAGGGFRQIAETRAWSWQQGPMLQWAPRSERIVFNDRVGDTFKACIAAPDSGDAHWLDRPIYALDPSGVFGLSLNFARLDTLRPGYGYAGGEGARLDVAAPADDGVWRIDLESGAARLILSLADAVATLHRVLTDDERAQHAAADFRYWFNHAKISPDGARLAVKLRWRVPGGKWTGLMGVSMTCGTDGADPRVIARAASHVMWHDTGHLYFWNQRDRYVARRPDTELIEPIQAEALAPDVFAANVHLRHLTTDPWRMVYDTPYSETVGLHEIDLTTGDSAPIATFPGHTPAKGPFRCDLHPVPTGDGTRIVVTAMSDGMRQVYALDRNTG